MYFENYCQNSTQTTKLKPNHNTVRRDIIKSDFIFYQKTLNCFNDFQKGHLSVI